MALIFAARSKILPVMEGECDLGRNYLYSALHVFGNWQYLCIRLSMFWKLEISLYSDLHVLRNCLYIIWHTREFCFIYTSFLWADFSPNSFELQVLQFTEICWVYPLQITIIMCSLRYDDALKQDTQCSTLVCYLPIQISVYLSLFFLSPFNKVFSVLFFSLINVQRLVLADQS